MSLAEKTSADKFKFFLSPWTLVVVFIVLQIKIYIFLPEYGQEPNIMILNDI